MSRLVAAGVAGSLGGLWIGHEAIGPLVTLLVWLAAFIYAATRARGGISFVEWLAVTGSVVILQLLLDLHTPHLGDLVIAALHATCLIAFAIARNRKARRAARPGALADNEEG